jgi:acyl-CoA synthetase (AMP-forming)/AMP-acid ligase II
MTELIHDLPLGSARRVPRREALIYQGKRLDYDGLAQRIRGFADALLGLDLARSERVAVYLEKRLETVVAVFGAAAAGGVFVPVNPLLKPDQVAYILRDCNVRILVTSAERLRLLAPALAECPDLHTVIVAGGAAEPIGKPNSVAWDDTASASGGAPHRVIDTDMAAILYTSGSTGKP